MSTLVPVMCVVCGVSRVVCVCGVGGAVGRVGGRTGASTMVGDAVGPVCWDVSHIGCPNYTAKPMGRIVAK